MPQTKAPQRNSAPPKGATRTPRAATSKSTPRAATSKESVKRTTDLSDDVLKSLESGQRAAIDAVRKFVDTVDEKLPALGERPSKRQDVVDAAMEMADRLVHTQYDFLRSVVQSAGRALSRQEDGR